MATVGIQGLLRSTRNALQTQPSRNAVQWMGARWSNAVRAQSKVTAPDDPPTAPLPEHHEIEGQCDFSNYIDRYPDVSLNQAVLSFGVAMGILYGTYQWAKHVAETGPAKFTRREFPTVESDIPHFSRIPKQ